MFLRTLTSFLGLLGLSCISYADPCKSVAGRALLLEAIYSPTNVCNWISKAFETGVACYGDHLSGGANDHWSLAASPIRDAAEGFIEVEVSLSGPGKSLTGTYPKGFERLTFIMMAFFSSSCKEVHYVYLRLAEANPRSIEEISIGDRNTVVLTPVKAGKVGLRRKLTMQLRPV